MNFLPKYVYAYLFIILIIAGCRSSNTLSYHISPDVDFSFVKKVAVMPLENLTDDKHAGNIVRQLVITELLASGFLDVSAPGEVMSTVRDLDIKNISSPNNKQMRAIGDALNVQAIVIGSVEQYGYVKFGQHSAPEVTISLMMADSGTGDIIWSVTKTRGGASFMARHFGAKSETMSETVLAAVREAISTLTEY